MTITQVTYRRLVTTGNYSNEAVEATATVEDGESAEGALDALKAWVCERLNARLDITADRQAAEQAKWDLRSVEHELATARERWAKAVAFLAAHGVTVDELVG